MLKVMGWPVALSKYFPEEFFLYPAASRICWPAATLPEGASAEPNFRFAYCGAMNFWFAGIRTPVGLAGEPSPHDPWLTMASRSIAALIALPKARSLNGAFCRFRYNITTLVGA